MAKITFDDTVLAFDEDILVFRLGLLTRLRQFTYDNATRTFQIDNSAGVDGTMTIDPLYLKVNDLQPYYYAQFVDASGNAISLASVTIYCTMKNIDTDTIKINRQTAGITITDESDGKFEYEWQDGDTDTAGKYHIEFEIEPASGDGKYTLPADPSDVAKVIIEDSLDTI